jgi:hypothetical protein
MVLSLGDYDGDQRPPTGATQPPLSTWLILGSANLRLDH